MGSSEACATAAKKFNKNGWPILELPKMQSAATTFCSPGKVIFSWAEFSQKYT